MSRYPLHQFATEDRSPRRPRVHAESVFDERGRQVRAAASEAAERAIASVAADLTLQLRAVDAFDSDAPVQLWSANLLILALGKRAGELARDDAGYED